MSCINILENECLVEDSASRKRISLNELSRVYVTGLCVTDLRVFLLSFSARCSFGLVALLPLDLVLFRLFPFFSPLFFLPIFTSFFRRGPYFEAQTVRDTYAFFVCRCCGFVTGRDEELLTSSVTWISATSLMRLST